MPWCLLLIAASLLTGCSDDLEGAGDPLTVEQSDTLAAARFGLGRDVFAATLSWGDPDAVDHMSASLTVDPGELEAWGSVNRGPVDLAVGEPVQLTESAVAIRRQGHWQVREQGQLLERLRVVFTLAADRPENAQLLRQSDARYLGETTLDGERASVFRLPSLEGSGGHSRLWLDEAGDVLRLDSGDDRFVIRVEPAPSADPPDDGPLI